MTSHQNNHNKSFTPQPNILSVEKIGKIVGHKRIVRDISFTVKSGEVIGLLGPNGAGKTTTFYMIIGLVQADFGHISLDKEDITTLPIYKRAQLGISYLPQESSIFRGLNVEQNIMAILENNYTDDIAENKLESLLTEFNISHLRHSPATSLSGGERRRVEIARCIASNPKFILLDEPFAGIDPIAIGDIQKLIMDLKNRGIGVLITDHNVREALKITDHAYIIYEGGILASGSPKSITQNEIVRNIYLGQEFNF